MANIEPLTKKILKWEGGYTDDPVDRGDATNMGVTLATWHRAGYDKDGDGDIDENDLRSLSHHDAIMVLRLFYWNRWRADEIFSQAIAEILVDWLWCSGKWGIIIPQRILGVADDGIAGRYTLAAVNHSDPRELHRQVYESRIQFIQRIIRRDPKQKRFEKGWMNRLNDFTYQ
ncbi:MAG: glycosyl hydrolase 108 family protein [Pseudomonadota bacterium]